MIDVKRRFLLKYALGASAIGVAAGAGLLPMPAIAAAEAPEWPKDAFRQENVDEAVKALYGQTPTESDKIRLRVPTIAENGAVVPVSVEASLPGVTGIAVIVAENPNALAATFNLPQGALPFVSTRVKMAETSDVMALVVSEGKVYSTTQNVKVTIGGCGG